LSVSGVYTLAVADVNNDWAPPVNFGFNVFDKVPVAAIPIVSASSTPASDLQVKNFAVSAPSGLIQSGAPINVFWDDANIGATDADVAWSDRLIVANMSTGAIIADQVVSGGPSTLAAGASASRQATLTLPPGAAGAGDFKITVIANQTHNLPKSIASSTDFSNDTASIGFTSTLAVYPDLVVSRLTTSPNGNFAPGDTVTISWTTSNQGQRDTGAKGWAEQLIVTNTTTGGGVATLPVVQPDATALAAGASLQRSVQFKWPSGGDASGKFAFAVTVDSGNALIEANVDGSGESNNAAIATVLSAPNILVQALTQTGGQAQAGGPLSLSWTDYNAGVASTPNAWTDLVQVYNVSNGALLAQVAVPVLAANGVLASGDSLARSVTISLPDTANAVGQLTVRVTSDRDVNNRTQITQVAADGGGVGANSQDISFTSLAAAHAGLTASNLKTPASGTAGSSIAVSYTVSNSGNATTKCQLVGRRDRLLSDGSARSGD
jgi:hypothetical protein